MNHTTRSSGHRLLCRIICSSWGVCSLAWRTWHTSQVLGCICWLFI